MTKREPLRSEEYFDEFINFKRQIILEGEKVFSISSDQFARPDIAAMNLLNYKRSLITAEYSRGYEVEEISQYYPDITGSIERLCANDKHMLFTIDFNDGIDDYTEGLYMITQAYLLGAEEAELLYVIKYIGNEGKDLLFERLIKEMMPGLVRKSARKLLYTKAYQSLYEALDAPSEQQGELLRVFLKGWYKNMRNTSWYDAHKGQDGGGFDGYWCWEAAGVAVAFGINDHSFRDMLYYPKDLADFARMNASV